MKKLFGGRGFQFWHYKVSRGELLLRSPKNDNNSKNIDIMFFDVIYVELPRFLPNLEIGEVKNEDVFYIKAKIDSLVKFNSNQCWTDIFTTKRNCHSLYKFQSV